MRHMTFLGALLCLGQIFLTPQKAFGQTSEDDYIADLELEDLLSLEVTSAAKKKQSVADSAAAVFVLTQTDIHRSGATSIPEALRMVPGVEVAQSGSNNWAVSIRGFNSRLANKLLVLVDGRPIYIPSFSFVLWDQHMPPLKDIERIEVVRGPGGTIWGSNAVNGVINIITKHSVDTLGAYVSVGAGTYEEAQLSARYGAQLSDTVTARIYANLEKRDSVVDRFGTHLSNGFDDGQVGFRLDWQASERDQVTFSGDFLKNNFAFEIPGDAMLLAFPAEALNLDGGGTSANLVTRWTRKMRSGSDLYLQLSFDHQKRTEFTVPAHRDQLDVDFTYRTDLDSRNELIWGLNYRMHSDKVAAQGLLTFDPLNRTDHLVSAFLQDELRLLDGKLRLTFGSKFEHNDVTQFEVQPSIRALYSLGRGHAVWAAISRSVRTPSRLEENGTLLLGQAIPPGDPLNPTGFPLSIVLTGNDDLKAEDILSFEAGYRVSFGKRASIDLAVHYNDFNNLVARVVGQTDFQLTPTGPLVVQYGPLTNAGNGHSYGLEASLHYAFSDRVRADLAYTYFNLNLGLENGLIDFNDLLVKEGVSPKHQLSLRTGIDVTDEIDLDVWLRYVGALPRATFFGIDDYVDLDVRLGWRLNHRIELVLAGQNLLKTRRQEFLQDFNPSFPANYVERGVYARVNVSF